MEKIYKSEKAKSIGVSNWTIPGLEQLLKFAEIPPHANEIEIHPFLPNDELVNYCFSKKIMPTAYSPLGSQNQVPTTGERVSENKTLNDIAAKGGNTLAQVLIAWVCVVATSCCPRAVTLVVWSPTSRALSCRTRTSGLLTKLPRAVTSVSST